MEMKAGVGFRREGEPQIFDRQSNDGFFLLVLLQMMVLLLAGCREDTYENQGQRKSRSALPLARLPARPAAAARAPAASMTSIRPGDYATSD